MLMLVLLLVIVVVLVAVARTLAWSMGAQTGAPEGPAAVDDKLAGAVRRARQRLRRAEESYAARVGAAEEGLTQARQDVEVLRVGPVVLGRCTVLVSGREHELTEETRFEFVREGSVTYRLAEEGGRSRIVEDDGRTGRLVVTGPGWEEEAQVIPADFADAERLVAAGQAATRTVTTARRERAERVERAWKRLEEARAGRTEVEEARMTLEDLEGSGPRVWDVPEPPEED